MIQPGSEADIVVTVDASLIPAGKEKTFTFPIIIEGVDARPSDRTLNIKSKLYQVTIKNKKPDMKNIFKLTALAVFLCCLVSCDDDEPIIPTLEVTPANLNGTWELSEWNGTPLAEGTYCYVVFNRKEQTFEMYQKFDSMYARYITGSFSIKNDPYLGAVISGEYDFGNGEWNNKYIVTDLLESGSMIWTAKDNENDVNKYIRCEKVPENIIAEAKSGQGRVKQNFSFFFHKFLL